MRREPTEVKSLGERGQARLKPRRAMLKRSRLRHLALDSLEPRTLMATAPISVVTAQAQVSTGSKTIDDSSPWVAVDPVNPLKMVSAFTRRDTTSGTVQIYTVANASNDGGKSWPISVSIPGNLLDPTTTNPVLPYAQAKASGVGFDQHENLYIGVLEVNGAGNSGAVVVQKYDFTGGSPVLTAADNIAYQWNQAEANNPAAAQESAIINATLAVDDNVASYTDPTTGATQTDPTAGSVFIAWTTNKPPPPTPPNPYNPYTIEMVASTDGTFPAMPMGMDSGVQVSRGHFGPAGLSEPRIAISQGRAGGTGGQATVVWDDFGALAQANPPEDLIQARTATFNGSTLSLNSISTVATTFVRGAATPNYSITSAASAIGIGPGAAIAIDNTLGSFSPHQGRIYVTYVDRYNDPKNQPDNTDIFLVYSDDGGSHWSGLASQVNDDSGVIDGFSGGVQPADPSVHYAGRSQFEPSVAVDKTTGTVALSWLDARDDASRTRYADYLTTSIDGGNTFSPDVFANQPNLVTDAITGKQVVVGPYSDNPTIETSLGVGTHQALVIANGVIHPVWVSTLLDGFNGNHQTIETAQATYPYGPRILSSTMGPVQSQTVDGITFNNTFSPTDHTPQVDGFVVTFDRPVDISTFTASEVQAFYRSVTTPLDTPGTAVPLDASTPVTALDAGAIFPGEATTFFVKFATPQTAVGTYSYSVGPNISDRMRVPAQIALTPDAPPVSFTATPAQPIPDSPARGISSTISVPPVGVGEVVAKVTVQVTITHPYDSDLLIQLVSPQGVTVTLSQGHGGSGANYNGTIFDDSAFLSIATGVADFPGSYRPDQPLSTFNAGQVSGNWALVVTDTHPGFTGTLQSWTLSITTGQVALGSVGTGNAMDQNANGVPGESTDVYSAPKSLNQTPFFGPFDTTTLPIILPGPHIVSTFVPFAAQSPDNLVMNNSVGYLDVVFDRDINPATFTNDQVLSMTGPNGAISGPFTVTPELGATPGPNFPQPDENASHIRTFRIAFPFQQLSGTYTVTLGTKIQSVAGDAVDTNRNAGLDRLFDRSSASTTDVVYPATIPVGGAAITAGNSTVSTIKVVDSYPIQNVQLSLNITYPNDPDLEASLSFQPTDANGVPNGPVVGPITLFKNLGNIGQQGTRGNFNNTIFDDNPLDTPIQNGAPPYFGRFTPQIPFSRLLGLAARGVFTLTIKNDATGGVANTGTLNRWSLTLTRNTDAGVATGLGEPTADRSEASFRIFTMDPTNPLSSNTWTAVGPASNNGNGNSSRIGGIAIDPSDPSGNTAYVAGASGGVWKTYDFLTNNPQGPTYVPLTDFGPTTAINIGSIAVFGRNNDPNQSIVVAATGEGDSGSTGVGFLISFNGGSTWSLLDSTQNVDANGAEIPAASRDHAFVGTTSYKLLIDPHPTPSGDIIIYAAMGGNDSKGNARGGVWRSVDSGRNWIRVRAGGSSSGDATDIVFDPNSGGIDAFSNPTGNIRTLYAAFLGDGVYSTPNQGGTWNLLAGGVGDPLIQDSIDNPTRPIPVSAPVGTPNGAKGRIVLAKPALTGDPILDTQYETWLYAAVSTPAGALDGLYMTKDNGQNWVKVRLANYATSVSADGKPTDVNPTNDITQPDINILGTQGNYNIALAIDPSNPNIVYLGGTKPNLIRIDTTRVSDAHSLFVDSTRNGGGTLENTTSPVVIKDPKNLQYFGFPDPIFNPYLNLLRDPSNPFLTDSTIYVDDTKNFANDGSGARWTLFGSFLGGVDLHRIVTIKDQTTGKTRLIVGLDQGVFSAIDNGDGTLVSQIGTETLPTGSRNGNLQINQFYNGAAQPSALAAQIAGALFYGMAQDNGFPASDPNLLNNGNLAWSGGVGDGQDVATDQTGTGSSYSYRWPCCGGYVTNFFQVSDRGGAPVGRTFGLIQASNPGKVPDPQWPDLGGFNFAVNPLDGNQIMLGSGAGRLFGTDDQGRIWQVIADPSALDSSVINALAYGAPDPGPNAALNNYLLVGTDSGHIFASFVGGGSGAGNAWINISNGLNGESVRRIVTNPNRGSHEAYAITAFHVYHNADTTSTTTKWDDITGDLFSQMHTPFGDPTIAEALLKNFGNSAAGGGLAADWRYVIPNDPTVVGGATHPMLYVAGEAGVFRSTDNGKTWRIFPDQTLNTPVPGGNLPNAHVTDLDMVLGNINPTTGHPDVTTGPNLLLATTYGRGSFGIRLAPIVFNDGTNNVGFTTDANGNLFFNGLSEQTAFGNQVAVTIVDVTNPASPIFLGGYSVGDRSQNPADLNSFFNTANQTDAFGKFSVQGTYPTAPPNNPYLYDGIRTVQIFATDASGTKGNVVNFQITNNPPTPPAPLLTSAHLIAGNVDVTGVSSPSFTVTIPNNNTIPVNVTLLRIDSNGIATPVATTSITGTGTITDPGPVAHGTYSYEVRYSVNVGALTVTSQPSPPTVVQFVAGLTAALDPLDDSGVKGDNKTNVTQPRIIGTAPLPVPPGFSLDLVQIVSTSPFVTRILATVPDPNDGNYTIQPSTPLADGNYTLYVQLRDSAGNTIPSNTVMLTIKTTGPTLIPTLGILPADDTAPIGDGRTTVRRPHFVGVSDPGSVVQIFDGAGVLEATVTASTTASGGNPAGYFSAQLPFDLVNGQITLKAYATDVEGNSSPRPGVLNVTIYTVSGDYNNTGKADLAIYRPSTAQWFIRYPDGTQLKTAYGWAGHDVPIAGDFVGNGRTDIATYRPETAQWFINEGALGQSITQYGTPGLDTPVPAVYDTGGKTEIAVYESSTATWSILHSNGSGQQVTTYGWALHDKPVPGNYDGNGYDQLALYRPIDVATPAQGGGTWFIRDVTAGRTLEKYNFGNPQAGDIPVPGDYDGIGRTEPALYRPSTSTFIIYNPVTNTTRTVAMGAASTAVPVPQDYEGLGKVDPAVYDPTTSTWTYLSAISNTMVSKVYGWAGHDVAVPGPLAYRVAAATGGQGIGVPAAQVASGTSQTLVAPPSALASAPASQVVIGAATPAAAKTRRRPNDGNEVRRLVTLSQAKLHQAHESKHPHDVALNHLGRVHKGRFFS